MIINYTGAAAKSRRQASILNLLVNNKATQQICFSPPTPKSFLFKKKNKGKTAAPIRHNVRLHVGGCSGGGGAQRRASLVLIGGGGAKKMKHNGVKKQGGQGINAASSRLGVTQTDRQKYSPHDARLSFII